jgi:hypothetical protein
MMQEKILVLLEDENSNVLRQEKTIFPVEYKKEQCLNARKNSIPYNLDD